MAALVKLYQELSAWQVLRQLQEKDRRLDVRENGDSTARRWLDAGIDEPSCVSEGILWRSTCPGGLVAADWLQFLQEGVGVQCLAGDGPGAQLQSSQFVFAAAHFYPGPWPA